MGSRETTALPMSSGVNWEMKTYIIKDNNGNPFAFEIDNVYISIQKLAQIISTLKEIKNIKTRKLFEQKNEYHIEFEYAGYPFVVWEPFGDSSRYWIGPKDTENKTDKIKDIEEIIRNYKLPILIKLFGDLISLNFKNILRS